MNTAGVIDCRRLTRWYGPVMGLAEMTCAIPPGITGLLGPNGAGKTTFIRLVTGQLLPSEGEVHVLGEPPFANGRILAQVGFCPDEDALYDGFTARAMITRLVQMHGYALADARARAESALAAVGLTEAADRKVGVFSKGMRQRVKLAQAIAHGPRLLVLDEPMTGTDPQVRAALIAAIRTFADAGGSVLVSSHVLHEVEALTSRVLVLYGNRMLAFGDIQELRATMEDVPHRIRVTCDRPRDLARALFASVELRGCEVTEGVVEVRTFAPAALYQALPQAVVSSGVRVLEITPDDVDLQSVFTYLTK